MLTSLICSQLGTKVKDSFFDIDEFLGDRGRKHIRAQLQMSADLRASFVSWKSKEAKSGSGNGASGSGLTSQQGK